MNPNPGESKDRNELRRRAEETLKANDFKGEKFAEPEGMTLEVQELIHELQVHQIELEMQNDELEQALENLAAARDRYFDLFDLAPVGYFMLTEDGTIFDVNLAGAELLGVQRSELSGKALSHFVHEQDQDIYFLRRRRASQSKTQVECDLRLKKADGREFYAHLEYAQSKDPAGQLRLIVTDITQRVLSEHRLAKDKAILSSAERMVHLGGWEWDIEKDEVWLSEELQRIYGCEKSCYSMKDFLHLAHPEDQESKKDALEKALSGDAPLNFGHRILRQTDRVERYIQVSGEVFYDKTGKPLKFFCASQDVTELKENERRLRAYTAHLEALNRDLESFNYMASHDLQAPLRKIQKFAEIVKTRLPRQMDEEVVGYIDRMQKAAARAQSLIADLLKYSQVTKRILSFEQVCLNDIVLEVLEDLDPMIENSQMQLDMHDLPVLFAEPTLMKQLFQNLIENAVKFHLPEQAPSVRIESAFLSPQMVEIRIIDQGIGFDEMYLEKIFRPFERLHPTHQFDGTGIGLAICRKIVERHSGSITAQSEPGKGATFIITLPIHQS